MACPSTRTTSPTKRLRADAARWRYVREILEVTDEKTLSGKMKPFLSVKIGTGRMPDGAMRATKPEAVDEAIDTAIATRNQTTV